MKKYLTVANALTSIRILGALCMLFITPFTVVFNVIYIVCGLSDAFDGFVARLMKNASDFGAKLDSVADLLFYASMFLRVMPKLISVLDGTIWYFVIAVLAIRLASYVTALVKYKKFASLHTYFNKLTGFLVFFVPLIIQTNFFNVYCCALCAISGFASAEELFIHLFSKSYSSKKTLIYKNAESENNAECQK